VELNHDKLVIFLVLKIKSSYKIEQAFPVSEMKSFGNLKNLPITNPIKTKRAAFVLKAALIIV
jgi:hypothetical protein